MALSPLERENLIRRYAGGPARLKAALAAVPAEALQWRPKPGEWSAHEVVVHCADSETNAAGRIRYLAAEPDPVILGRMPEDVWPRVGRHTESGRYGAEDWLTIYAEHLEVHAAQIEANAAAWRAARDRAI